jgi:Tol biopolymer transport system component
VEFSPDGKSVALVEYGSILVFNTKGELLRRLRSPDGLGLNGRIAFVPDGKTIAFGLGNVVYLLPLQ